MPSVSKTHTNKTIFDTLYTKLNPGQKTAVDTIEGPVMVVAGPGTGKTQTLAMRIANILRKTDVAAHNILAITFTENGTKAMRERLLSIIGEDAYYVDITTFHAFCSDIIQSNPEYFRFSRNAEPLSDLERFSLIQSIISSEKFEYIKPINSPFFYVLDCIRAIQNLKRENVSIDSFRKMISSDEESLTEKLTKTELKKKETFLNRNKELLQVYTIYQQKLLEMNRYDFEDMISLTVETLQKDEILLQIYQERFQYILVDEYQDTNNAQNMLLQLLTSYWGEQANIFVVGDSDQSLYRFQGASIENSLEFLKRFPKATVITLKENYRSTQNILDAAHDVIQKNAFTLGNFVVKTGRKDVETSLHSQQKTKTPSIFTASLSSNPLEAAYVAENIKKRIDAGTNASEIAIIYRNNADSAAFEDALAKWDIPYEVDGGSDVLSSHVMHQLLTLFTAIDKIRTSAEDIELFTLLNYAWLGFDELDILKLSRFAATKKISIMEAVLKYDLKAMELSKHKEIGEFVKKLKIWSQLDAQETFPVWFETVILESGFLDWILNKDTSVEYLNQLNSLFGQVKKVTRGNKRYNLTQFLKDIEIMQEHNIGINEEDLNVKTDAVRLTTAHRAKGLEWEHVFVVNVIDKKWGNVTVRELIHLPDEIIKHVKIEEKEKNEDERRIFYVALTRAKTTVTITYAKTTINANRTKDNFPSMFIEELPKKLKEDIDVGMFEKDARKYFAQLLHLPKRKPVSIEEKEWLKGILDGFVLTPTALNTYLECPYKFKLNTLMKVPRAKKDYLAFGTAIHKALELLHISLMQHDLIPPKEYVLSEFEKALKKEVLTQEEEEKRLLQGQKVLSAYYDEYKEAFKKPLFVEKFFGYGWSMVYLDDIRLGGKIDKIEWLNEKNKTVTVVDYKTGQPKSRNEIEGKTAYSNGAYMRQLVFYKLLTDLDKTFQLKVEKGVLDFIEPVKVSGKFKQEEFLINESEIEELKNVIKDAMKHIRSLDFPRTTDYSICQNCEFKHHCWPEGIPKLNVTQLPLLES